MNIFLQIADDLFIEEDAHISDVFVVVDGGNYAAFVEAYDSVAEVGINHNDGGTSLAVLG